MRAGVYGRQSAGSKKSVADQLAAGEAAVAGEGWELQGQYSDLVSASRYSDKARDAWQRVQLAVAGGALDVLVLWESSRGDRTPETWFAFLSLCRKHGVRIHVVSHERTYNLTNARDWKVLAEDGVTSAYESELLSARTRRGVASAAAAGRPPAGPAPYGYRRSYDPGTGALVGQEPDPETAPIVVEIITRVAASVPVSTIAKDLNDRGVRPPSGKQWYRQRVREIALNRRYIGLRKHRDTWHPAAWPALVDAETFYTAQRVLADPGRAAFGQHARPGKQKHLLTYLATCARCASQVSARETAYVCPRGCMQIQRRHVDALIGDLVLARLADPDVYSGLRHAGQAADAEVAAAREELAALRARLDGFRVSAALGQTSPESLATIEGVLAGQIATLERRITAATVPAALQDWVGPEADLAARWAAAPVQAQRAVLRALGLAVALRPSGQSSYVPVHQRVHVEWTAPQ